MSDGVSDLILRLSEGVEHPEKTLRNYVVTEQLVSCFDSALGLIRAALEARSRMTAPDSRHFRALARRLPPHGVIAGLALAQSGSGQMVHLAPDRSQEDGSAEGGSRAA